MWRRTILVFALWACPVVSLGCGGHTNDNVPVVVIDEELLEKMGQDEAERMERYRELAEGKGWKAPATVSPDGGPRGVSVQKREEAAAKRKSAAQAGKKKSGR
jgi:hypothetical protein